MPIRYNASSWKSWPNIYTWNTSHTAQSNRLMQPGMKVICTRLIRRTNCWNSCNALKLQSKNSLHKCTSSTRHQLSHHCTTSPWRELLHSSSPVLSYAKPLSKKQQKKTFNGELDRSFRYRPCWESVNSQWWFHLTQLLQIVIRICPDL